MVARCERACTVDICCGNIVYIENVASRKYHVQIKLSYILICLERIDALYGVLMLDNCDVYNEIVKCSKLLGIERNVASERKN